MYLILRTKLLGILSLTAFFGFSQNLQNPSSAWCHSHSYFNEMMKNDSTIRINYEKTIAFADKYVREKFIPGRGKAGQIYIIPVVFHVIHTNGPENLSNATIQNTINQLNVNYRKLRSDTAFVEAPFDKIYPDCEIEFRLAKIDPDGYCTEGITRTYSSLHIEASDAVKSLIAWPNHQYLNIWTVSSIGISASAYAQFPGGPNSTDGIVCMAGSLGSLTHEIGHHLGLPHTWGPTNDPGCDGTATTGPCAGVDNCNLEDAVGDTPNARGTFGCWNLRYNSCGDSPIPFLSIYGDTIWPVDSGEIHENLQNYMSYAGCGTRNFTDGQKARMHGILNSSTNGRNNLWSDSNLIATGTNSGFTCEPVATPDFSLPYEYFCTDEFVSTQNYSYGSDLMTFLWDFGPTSSASSTTAPEPDVSYALPGFYDITLTASNAGGSRSITKAEIAKVLSGVPIEPFHETFASSDFPVNHPNDFSQNWFIHALGDSVPTWERNIDVSTDGGSCIKLDLKKTSGTHRLFAPMLDLTQGSCDELTFDLAYAGRTTLTIDKFSVRVSTTCGKTWPQSKIVYEVQQQDIAPHQLTISGDYVPTSSDWKSHTVDLSQFQNEKNIIIMFEVETSSGNALYMDNVVFGCSSRSIASTLEHHTLEANLIPNPSDGNVKLSISGSVGNTAVMVNEISGKQIGNAILKLTEGGVQISMQDIVGADIASGVYMVTITNAGSSVTKKMIIK